MEHKIGEVLDHLTGFPVVVVESDLMCVGCLFEQSFGLGCSFPEADCFWYKRADKKNIIYKRQQEYQERTPIRTNVTMKPETLYDIVPDSRKIVRTLLKAHRIHDIIQLNDCLVKIRMRNELITRYTHDNSFGSLKQIYFASDLVITRLRAMASRIEIIGR